MSPDISIKLGGLFNLAFVVFHALFWRIFDWKHELRSLSFLNRQIMQVLNLCLMFAFLVFAYISFFHADELTGTALGRTMLLLISVFWLLRGMEQAMFFRLKRPLSVAFMALFIIGAGLYAYPLLIPATRNPPAPAGGSLRRPREVAGDFRSRRLLPAGAPLAIERTIK